LRYRGSIAARPPHEAGRGGAEALTIRPLESDVERVYASIRVALEKKGTPIGAHDLLIAAHARALAAVCVTDNVVEFQRVPALRVENWLR
jgi:tRNA(fMet)-specific endonuclease VapC